jgi:polyisoprenoid-binding protein YceI
MRRILTAAVAALALAAPFAASADTFEIDTAHSSSGFSVRHLMVSNVKGEFAKVTGTLNLDDKDVTKSTVEATIDVNTLTTREPKRDEHLKSPEFFDAAKYPTITFKSTKVEKAGEGKLAVTGDLTLHGVTKPVVLAVEGPTAEQKDPWGNTKRGASASTKISRKEFGLTWNKALETGGAMIGDEVAINIDLELNKKAPAAPAAAAAKPEAKPAAAETKPAKATKK